MQKINVRSPFYLTANAETAPVVIPPTAPLQIIPVTCGQTFNSGIDVGENKFEFNTDNVGDVFITVTGGQVPIRFVVEWNGTSVDTGYIGSSDFNQSLLDAGVDVADINTASPSNKNTIITLDKTAATPTLVTVRAYAPLVNDDYELTFDCPPAQVPTVACDAGSQYNGGAAFPQTDIVDLGSSTGVVTLDFNARAVPDKFIVKFDGVVVIDTGYRGSPNTQTILNNALAQRGLPPETIQGLGQGTVTFNKTTATTTATVEVYAPIGGTVWSYTLSCPQ